MQAMYLGTLRNIKLFFYYLETAVAVQRQVGYAVGVLQKFQIFFMVMFLKELLQQWV